MRRFRADTWPDDGRVVSNGIIRMEEFGANVRPKLLPLSRLDEKPD